LQRGDSLSRRVNSVSVQHLSCPYICHDGRHAPYPWDTVQHGTVSPKGSCVEQQGKRDTYQDPLAGGGGERDSDGGGHVARDGIFQKHPVQYSRSFGTSREKPSYDQSQGRKQDTAIENVFAP